MLNAKSSENFPSPDQNWANFGGFRGQGFQKVSFLLQKAHLCVNPRRLSDFASKSVEGCDLQVGSGKKPVSHRDSHRKDNVMSPLTKGLNYRSARDSNLPSRGISLIYGKTHKQDWPKDRALGTLLSTSAQD